MKSTKWLSVAISCAVAIGLCGADTWTPHGVARAAARPQTPSPPSATGSDATPPAQQASALSPEDIARVRAHQERLVIIANLLPSRTTVAGLLGPMLTFASRRSTSGHAIEENRAALFVVTFYVNGWPLEAITPDARSWPRAPRRGIVLRERGDLAQHFTVSALIAAAAGQSLADAAGVYKELSDARGGSGFSFSDLAADRAGTTFGLMATASSESASRLQGRLTEGITENDLMPLIEGLPDNLTQAEFTRRFGGVNTPAYNTLVDDINRRVAALSLFQ